MPEVTRHRQGEIVRKVFEVLLEHPDGLAAREVIAEVERRMKLTAFEISTYPNNPMARRFDKNSF